MPGPSSIRIRDKDIDKIKKLNKAVSSKKSYLKKTYGVMVDVWTQGITSFETRKEFDRYVKQMERFMTNEFKERKTHLRTPEGKLLPKREVKSLQNEIKRVNRLREKRIKELEKTGMMYKGKKSGSIRQAIELGDPRFEGLKPLQMDVLKRFTSEEQLKEYLRKFKETFRGDYLKRKDMTYKEKYLKGLENKLGDILGGDPEYLQLVKHIQSLKIKEFMQFYYTRKFTALNFLYDVVDAKSKLNRLLGEWEIDY